MKGEEILKESEHTTEMCVLFLHTLLKWNNHQNYLQREHTQSPVVAALSWDLPLVLCELQPAVPVMKFRHLNQWPKVFGNQIIHNNFKAEKSGCSHF